MTKKRGIQYDQRDAGAIEAVLFSCVLELERLVHDYGNNMPVETKKKVQSARSSVSSTHSHVATIHNRKWDNDD